MVEKCNNTVNIPKEWIITTIEELINQNYIEKPLDGNHGNIHPKSKDYVPSGIPFIMANNVSNGTVDLINCNFITEKQADSLMKGFAKENDVLLTHKGTIGNTAIVPKLTVDYIMLTPQVTYYRVKDKERIYNKYIKAYFDSYSFQTRLKELSGGGTRAYIGIVKQQKLPFVLPEIEEQKAIATVLSDTDDLILSLEKLINKKKMIKEGAMEELLTGKKRLDGFNESWNYKPLGEVVNIKKGQIITEESAIKGNIPVVAGGKKPAYYHNKANRFGNTITISASGANAGYVSYYNEPIYASDCSTIEEGSTYSIQFIYQQLKLRQNEIYKMQTGGAQPHIHPSDLEPIIFSIPNTYDEQEAIATLLSDMDDEIEKLEKKLDKYKNIKNGMMEELLTGKRRLV